MTPPVYSGTVPEDVGGTPFPDGWDGREPDSDPDRGAWDEEFASVVFDEAFVRAAAVHEPTAVERLLAAAQARAEAAETEARRTHPAGERYDDGYGGFGHTSGLGALDDDGLDGPRDPAGPYGRPLRWHRPVAWVLALVMGVGMVALAFAAVYRGGSSGGGERTPPPASTSPEQGGATSPSVSAGHPRPAAVPVIPHSP
ncbi:hypothetical protein [Streptomyces cyaneogriseus]|uniref:SCO2584 family spore wall biosynthesis protein n=1 Tax=Streptomyces cyaneogriseus TaxID=68192 RepID=UPI00099C283B|nr:hypothetical protein [Streptomyces cyaneogriseus]